MEYPDVILLLNRVGLSFAEWPQGHLPAELDHISKELCSVINTPWGFLVGWDAAGDAPKCEPVKCVTFFAYKNRQWPSDISMFFTDVLDALAEDFPFVHVVSGSNYSLGGVMTGKNQESERNLVRFLLELFEDDRCGRFARYSCIWPTDDAMPSHLTFFTMPESSSLH